MSHQELADAIQHHRRRLESALLSYSFWRRVRFGDNANIERAAMRQEHYRLKYLRVLLRASEATA